MMYTIAIQAHGDNPEETPATITAVMQIDSDGSPHIVELTVRASESGGFPFQAAQQIDFEMLARALGGAMIAARPRPELTPGPEGVPASEEEKASGKKPSKAVVGAETAERPYRKMPDVEDVTEIFRQTGSVGKVARHYSVPRYTAQAWIDRLRRMGHLEEAKKRSD